MPVSATPVLFSGSGLSLRGRQTNQPIAIPQTQAAMAAVDAHPNQRSQPPIVNLPMTLRCAVISIITAITGTATTPLITALQYKALMGSSGVRVITMPSAADRANVP